MRVVPLALADQVLAEIRSLRRQVEALAKGMSATD